MRDGRKGVAVGSDESRLDSIERLYSTNTIMPSKGKVTATGQDGIRAVESKAGGSVSQEERREQ